MIWAAVASDKSKSRLMFMDEGFKVISRVYFNMLQKKVFPWLTENFKNK